ALFGHSGSQAPQLIHSSVILIAIKNYLKISNVILHHKYKEQA
ncbi:MAG: hypothetical protein RI982_909, partial [Bacteroidota bacterium]